MLSEQASANVRAAIDLLVVADRPVMVAGGGVTLANAEGQLLSLAERTGAAVVWPPSSGAALSSPVRLTSSQ